MRSGLVCDLMRAASRIAIVGVLGSLAAACSQDTVRLSANPFSNPFSSEPDPVRTGSISEPAPAPAMPRSSVQSQPLPPIASAPVSAPAEPRRPAAVAQMPSAGPSGWSAEGGTAVIVAPGETLGTLSDRYGVPSAAILSANNLSAREVSAGRRLVIPVYSATGAPRVSRATEASPAVGRVVSTTRLPERATPPRRVADSRHEAGARHEDVRHEAEARPARVRPGQSAAQRAAVQAAAAKPTAPANHVAAAKPVVVAKPVAAAKPTAPARSARAEVKPARVAAAAEPKTVKVEAAAPAPQRPAKPARVAAATPVAAPAPASAPAVEPVRAAPAPVAAAAPAKEPDNTGTLPPGGDFRWPARGRVITAFGGSGSNEGINIAVPDGTPVKAAGDGTVAYAGSEVKGYGNLVLIRHDNGFVSAYAHNGEIDVKRGQRVTRGQTIAKSGQTGNVTSPQLHFEIRKGSTPVDPMRFLASAN